MERYPRGMFVLLFALFLQVAIVGKNYSQAAYSYWQGKSFNKIKQLPEQFTLSPSEGNLPFRRDIAAIPPFIQTNGSLLYGGDIPNPDDKYWDDRFTFPGINGIVYTIAVAPDGDIYVGGEFTLAGTTPARNIARWDGKKWHDLNGGVKTNMSYPVKSMVFWKNDLYVGGEFDRVGGSVFVHHIARWDGSHWHALADSAGNGVYYGYVNALAVYRGDLYLGGTFLRLRGYNGVEANYIARWDGNRLTPVVQGGYIGLDKPVKSLAADDSALYVGGYFTYAGGVYTRRIARWDDRGWSALGEGSANGVNNQVNTIAISDGNIYVAGRFTEAGGKRANYIARWDGGSWHSLGDGISNGVNFWVHALSAGKNGEIYVGGAFETAGGYTSYRAAIWDGSQWHTMQRGLTGGIYIFPAVVFAVTAAEDRVYFGGSFTQASRKSANCIVEWRNGEWFPFKDGPGLGTNSRIIALAAGKNGDIYAGGGFTAAGDSAVNYIARWDGSHWHPLGSGIQKRYANIDPVYEITIAENGDVYVGGSFVSAGGVPANNIARWDGSHWHAIGTGAVNGVNDDVNAIAITKNKDIFIGGLFTKAGTVHVNHVVRWDGYFWYELGKGCNNGVDSYVLALATDDSNNIYVGGHFRVAGGDTVNRIAVWNGKKWSSLGKGFTGEFNTVYTLITYEDTLYAGGYLTNIDSISVNYIAKWYDNNWHKIGIENSNGVNNQVFALEVDINGNLYLGGLFTQAGDTAANLIAKWERDRWYPFGTGIAGFYYILNFGLVWDIAISKNDIYFAGQYSEAGNKPSHCFSLWNKPVLSVANSKYEIKTFRFYQNYPNPFNPVTTIKYSIPIRQRVLLEAFDILGQRVATLVNEYQIAGEYSIRFDGRNLPSGLYFIKMMAGETVKTKKMLLLK